MTDNYNDWMKSFTIGQKATMINRINEGKTFHGVSKTKEYRTLIAMKTRCYNPNFKKYRDYGGRGIKICDRWLDKLHGYENFVADMGRCPKGMNSIDRINVNGDYEPGNCRWADHYDQNDNKRTREQIIADRAKYNKENETT